jgi:dihydroorotase
LYDCLLKGAQLVDPSQGIDGVFDIAISDGNIACIAAHIPVQDARVSYPLAGKIVTPGLIDAHCHPSLHFSDHSVFPDDAGVNAGVLLVNDAGSAGAANFHTLRQMYYGKVKSEMTFFVNFASAGLIHSPEIRTLHDIDIKLLKSTVEKNRDVIKGIKLRALEPLAAIAGDVVQLALDTAEELNLPLMLHIGDFRARTENDPLDAYSRGAVSRLRKGDIISHYMTWRPGGMVLPSGEIFPELRAAKERGVILDSSHGKNNFSFKVAEVLLANGFGPDVISTDLSSMGVHCVQSLLVTLSKFIDLGMSLSEVVAATTCRAAQALGIDNEWGSLKVGRNADISVIERVAGDFDFFDGVAGNYRKGSCLLEPRLVFRKGDVLACRSYYHLANEA